MRKILFRGKENLCNKWVYGDLVQSVKDGKTEGYFIAKQTVPPYEVNTLEIYPETAGQFTGLIDRNGIEIFEGDVLRWRNQNYIVTWDNRDAEFKFALKEDDDYFISGLNLDTTSQFCEVIGNIHDGTKKNKAEKKYPAADQEEALEPEYEADGYDDKGELDYDTAYCPICHYKYEVYYDYHDNFCRCCGQKLDWSRTNDEETE